MSHTRLWTSAGIIAVVIVVSFMLSVPHTRDVVHAPSPEAATANVPIVTLHDAFKKGMHTITGSLITPNACTPVTAVATVAGSNSTQSILVAITMPEDTGVCLQEPTRTSFSATVSAKTLLPIQATVNGLVATTTAS